jgi:hypothetical protein
MSNDFIGICITIFGSLFIGAIAIAVAIYFGLKSTVNPIADRLSLLKDDLITELSNIKERIIQIDNTADKVWQFATVYFAQQGSIGTVTRRLKNYGETKISASPESDFTIYNIKIEQGRLNSGTICKISKETTLEDNENRMFPGKGVSIQSLGSNLLTLRVPSTDPEVCTKYMSMFLRWLDTEYVEKIRQEIKQYEDDITL